LAYSSETESSSSIYREAAMTRAIRAIFVGSRDLIPGVSHSPRDGQAQAQKGRQAQRALKGQQKLWVGQTFRKEFGGQGSAAAGEMTLVAATAARASTRRASFLRMDNLLVR
jgi:hypothetical protein